MIRKICPICDQVMGTSHYCKNCRSWIRHPYVRDVSYYLNESHLSGEVDCSYHYGTDPASDRGGHAGGWAPGPKTTAGRPMVSLGPIRRDPPHRVGKTKNLIVIITILAVIKLIGWCVDLGVDAMITSKTAEPEYDVDLGGFYGEEETWGTEYIELEDEEVIAAGIACSREYHFAVSGKELEEPILEILEDHDIAVEDIDTYSYNNQYENGDTLYVTWTNYAFAEGETDSYDSLEVEYDTATGELHEIYMTLGDIHVLTELTGDVLELLKSRGALLPEELSEEPDRLVREGFSEKVMEDGYYELSAGPLRVEGMRDEIGYSITIYRDKD